MLEEPAAALAQFAAIPIRNIRIKAWIKEAHVISGSEALIQNPIDQAADAASQGVGRLKAQQLIEDGSSAAEAVQSSKETQQEILTEVQAEATETARQVMEASGEEDYTPTKSEVVGIATAAAAAVVAEIGNQGNIPEALKRLDPEQRAAAMTDGRVLVAAGAGSGKTTTLAARVNLLVKERHVSPNRILVTSFSSGSAKSLRDKISRDLGEDVASQMSGGGANWTMHGIFKRQILSHGSLEEQSAMKSDPSKVGGMTASVVQDLWESCYDEKEFPLPTRKTMEMWKSKWSGNGVTPAQAKAQASSRASLMAAMWYEMYEGLKGSIPGWKPPCEDKARSVRVEDYETKLQAWRSRGSNPTYKPSYKPTRYEGYMAQLRPKGERVGDFDDMLIIFRDILKRDPGVRTKMQRMFEHVNVDECLHEETLVQTEQGAMTLKDLQPGQKILSFENGVCRYKRVLDKKVSRQTRGLTVVLESGRELTMTPNHRVYASEFHQDLVPEGHLALYLMYRQDKGYRLGVSKNPSTSGVGCNPRVRSERADALWVLEVGEKSEILFKEQQYSLKYRIPTYIFEGTIRGCDQERIDRIFSEFGSNGRALLEEYNLSHHYPHWTNTTYTGGSKERRTMTLHAHGPKGSKVSCSWSSGVEICPEYTISTSKKCRVLQRGSASYVELRKWAMTLANETGIRVLEYIQIADQRYTLMTGAALHVGMELPTWLEGVPPGLDSILRGKDWRAELQTVVARMGEDPLHTRGSVSRDLYTEIRSKDLAIQGSTNLPDLSPTLYRSEKIVEIRDSEEAIFYDISVEDSANFFANGVLSHNCQDLNSVQSEIFEMMTEHIQEGDGRSLWMVGDDSQAIYAFRGSRPDLFIGRHEAEGWTTRMIQTNYRCAPEIVDAANQLIKHNDNRLPMIARPNPSRARGESSILVETPEDDVSAALSVVESIKKDTEVHEDPRDRLRALNDHAVLTRTNAELHMYETACIVRGVPYARKGSSGIFGSPETKAILSYVQVLTGDDNAKKQRALELVVNKPFRAAIKEEQFTEAVQKGIRAYAKANRMNIDEVDPMQALLSEDLDRYILEGFRLDWQRRSAQEALDSLTSDLSMTREAMRGEAFSTKDLFDTILSFEGKTSRTNPATQEVEYGIPESLGASFVKARKKSSGDDDDDDDDDGSGPGQQMGSVAFLYELAKVDPTDPGDVEVDPGTPLGFKLKMERYVERMRDLAIDLNKYKGKMEELDAVYLSTVHRVKGLEWPNVTVAMPRGKFPLVPPQPKEGEEPPPPEETESQLEDERRLGYVAITRAKNNLRIVCPKVVGGRDAGLSPFIGEAQLVRGENVSSGVTVEEALAGTPKEAFAEDVKNLADWKVN
jgi:DNA helicase-2/ATP-dependent DNA helicase PcrA